MEFYVHCPNSRLTNGAQRDPVTGSGKCSVRQGEELFLKLNFPTSSSLCWQDALQDWKLWQEALLQYNCTVPTCILSTYTHFMCKNNDSSIPEKPWNSLFPAIHFSIQFWFLRIDLKHIFTRLPAFVFFYNLLWLIIWFIVFYLFFLLSFVSFALCSLCKFVILIGIYFCNVKQI